jgi:AcrR family transcriptional regulator
MTATPRSRSTTTRASRRVPRQERSQQTVDAILAATRMLVIQDGLSRLSTNRIARRAGVSIGSLYQYFPSKRAVLAELHQRHQAEGARAFHVELPRLVDGTLEEGVKTFVARMLEVHRVDPELHRALEIEGREPGSTDWERRALELVRLYLQRHRDALVVHDLEQAAFVVGLTVQGLVHGAIVDRPSLLSDAAFADGLVRMVLAYLTGPTEHGPHAARPA